MGQMEDYSVAHLQEMIRETEETLTQLKAELQRRQDLAQGYEIEHLEEHMKHAVVSLKVIKDFLALILEGYREKA